VTNSHKELQDELKKDLLQELVWRSRRSSCRISTEGRGRTLAGSRLTVEDELLQDLD
jgi:hypothetical protein